MALLENSGLGIQVRMNIKSEKSHYLLIISWILICVSNSALWLPLTYGYTSVGVCSLNHETYFTNLFHEVCASFFPLLFHWVLVWWFSELGRMVWKTPWPWQTQEPRHQCWFYFTFQRLIVAFKNLGSLFFFFFKLFKTNTLGMRDGSSDKGVCC